MGSSGFIAGRAVSFIADQRAVWFREMSGLLYPEVRLVFWFPLGGALRLICDLRQYGFFGGGGVPLCRDWVSIGLWSVEWAGWLAVDAGGT